MLAGDLGFQGQLRATTSLSQVKRWVAKLTPLFKVLSRISKNLMICSRTLMIKLTKTNSQEKMKY